MDINLLTSELLIDEGCRLLVYDDATGQNIVPGYTVIGNPTIGVGRALAIKGIRLVEAEALLADDIKGFVDLCSSTLDYWTKLDGTRQRVVVNMVFNLGMYGFKNFIHLQGFLRAGDYTNASQEILNSDAARKAPARYQRLAKRMLMGDSNSGDA